VRIKEDFALIIEPHSHFVSLRHLISLSLSSSKHAALAFVANQHRTIRCVSREYALLAFDFAENTAYLSSMKYSIDMQSKIKASPCIPSRGCFSCHFGKQFEDHGNHPSTHKCSDERDLDVPQRDNVDVKHTIFPCRRIADIELNLLGFHFRHHSTIRVQHASF